ncbi:MAG: hypothetical protein FWB78_11005 [Treponema sp.]|nr:hypothetical protein [Treponema sp.]
MFRRLLFVAVLLAGCTALAFSQARPVLGILPFTGGSGGDGETIATLISMEPEILSAFTVVPRTAALNAIFAEHYFQLAGLTDSDTIAGIGRMLNADYVLSGNIRRLGDRNLVIATIVNVETFQQVAGYYRTYGTIEEVVSFLPSMSRSIVDATLVRDAATVPNLAMLPFTLAPGIDEQDAETLSKILAIEIINTGSFVVLPRTSTIQAALEEMDFQMLGYTDDEGMAALGRAINADLVLSGGVHRLGVLNMFTAQVLRVADGSVVSGASRNYQVIADGIDLMAELAVLLTGGDIAIVVAPRPRIPMFNDPARFWSIGASGIFSFAEPVPAGGFSVQATLAPLRHSFLRIGCDFVFSGSGFDYGRAVEFSSRSITPFVHYALFLPFAGNRLGWYAGAGAGFMTTAFDVSGYSESVTDSFVAVDFVTGFNIGGWVGISYVLRTDFSSFSDRLSVGLTYRFRARGGR